MAWRCRFMSASAVPKSTQKVVHRVVVAWLAACGFSARHPAGSSYSTGMTNDGMMRRGAATDPMEQVGDALAAPRVASVAGEKSMWWRCSELLLCTCKRRRVDVTHADDLTSDMDNLTTRRFISADLLDNCRATWRRNGR